MPRVCVRLAKMLVQKSGLRLERFLRFGDVERVPRPVAERSSYVI